MPNYRVQNLLLQGVIVRGVVLLGTQSKITERKTRTTAYIGNRVRLYINGKQISHVANMIRGILKREALQLLCILKIRLFQLNVKHA